MARYWTALKEQPASPTPEQHLILLHPDADRPELGNHRDGGLIIHYDVHRLWEVEPQDLFDKTGLLRLVPLAKVDDPDERLGLIAQAASAIAGRLGRDDAPEVLRWMAQLANLYLPASDVEEAIEENAMPIDLSHTPLAVEARQQARQEALREVVLARFDNQQLADRTASLDPELITDALRAASKTTDTEFASWLAARNA